MGYVLATALLAVPHFLQPAFAQAVPYTMVGDSVFESLSSSAGNPIKGRAIVLSRQTGLCILCHSGPFSDEPFQGNLAPNLSISVASMTAAQLRARLIDSRSFNPSTIMPSYYRTSDLNRVAPKYVGQTILNAQEIEDAIAFLLTMNSAKPNE